MKTLRNAALVIAAGAALSACVPPTVSLKVSTTAVDATPASALTINAGESAVLHWSQKTNMPGSSGQTMTRDYVINPSDGNASSIAIAETCTVNTLSTDWACAKAPRTGTVNVTPYISGTYTLVGTERLYASVAGLPVPVGDPVSKQASVSVTVNQDVAISAVLPFVVDPVLSACITSAATASGATTTGQLVDLVCVGGATAATKVKKLQGLGYFYNLSTLDISNNAVATATGEPDGVKYLTHAISINLQQSGIACTKQKQIAAALPAATVLTGQGTSVPCP